MPATPAYLLLLLLLLAGAGHGRRFRDAAETPPAVQLAQGRVQGQRVDQPQGSQPPAFYTYEGVPYARPPVGRLRFKDPEEAEPWDGIKNATSPGSVCMQRSVFSKKIIGSEDCLFINVYTANPPSTWNSTEHPVAVWIHSGSFSHGWGHLEEYYPNSLLQHGLVLVSFNYRLGVMGFLNAENSEWPGNAGLKDAVLALKWVQKNIAAFGGDATNVTVFGNGAGGAIVHYLVLSPLAKGLFARGMAMSGSALAPWAFAEHPRRFAMELCGLPNSTACLSTATAEYLIDKQYQRPLARPIRHTGRHRTGRSHTGRHHADQRRAQKGHQQSPSASRPYDAFTPAYHEWRTPFVPSVDAAAGAAAFLPAAPLLLMRSGRFNQVPYVTGFTSAEAIVHLKDSGLTDQPWRWAVLNNDLETVLAPAMPSGLRTGAAAIKVRKEYLAERLLQSNDREVVRLFVQMYTDLMFAVSVVSTARLLAEGGAPVWLYTFSHEGAAPLKTNRYNAARIGGVAHGDDLHFLLQYAATPPAASQDADVRSRFVKMFFDFAKEGNPSNEWPQYEPTKEKYYNINTTFTAEEKILGQRMAFWRQLSKCEGRVCNFYPEVWAEQGVVKGRTQMSPGNCSFFSWQGIPYAQPPVGPLRFADPLPPLPWNGVRDAKVERNMCPQMTPDGMMGKEDCLFINVFTPRLASWLTEPLPVWMHIHGGGFQSGSGDQEMVGPEFAVCEDIMYVSINYRLSVLGFLYMQSAASGNAGLKDQVMGLQWVQKNIAAFGGDPNNVTLVGEGTGAICVHLHMLSPMSKGLFHRAIAQSSSAMSPWTVHNKSPLDTSRYLASQLNCSTGNDLDKVECLRRTDVSRVIGVANGQTFSSSARAVSFTFVPSPDYKVEGREQFLPGPPYELVTNQAHHAVPYLTGFCSRESIIALVYSDFRKAPQARVVDTSWEKNILPLLRVRQDLGPKKQEALQSMRQFFMEGKPLSNETLIQFLDLLTDVDFAEGIYYTVRKMAEANKAPVYQYEFDVDDNLNVLKRSLPNIENVQGAAHADDLGYLSYAWFLPKVAANSTAALVRRRMLKLWTNYVKTGNPTPNEDPLLQNVRWLPYTKEKHNYLHITQSLESKTDLNEARVNFWKTFYETYGNETANTKTND